jgi:cobalt/nickel transport system permease protein
MLWAVHIADGVLPWPWLAGGAVGAGLLAWLGARRISEEEIPRVAVLTAAFFVASLIHLPLPPTRVHLLLNGLVGIVLGLRAALAIPVALLLQALLLAHGGVFSLGVNTCVMLLPALMAWILFRLIKKRTWMQGQRARWLTGFLIGALTVLVTAGLNALVLLLSGRGEFDTLAKVVFVAHLPLAGVEGLVMGATIAFLAKVKPEILQLSIPPAAAAPANPADVERRVG